MSRPEFPDKRFMVEVESRAVPALSPITRGIVESVQHGVPVLSPLNGSVSRRLLYVDSYGGAAMWDKIKKGDMPPHHLRGCLELVRMGYEVALVEPLTDFYFNRHALPHDLRLLKLVRHWLGDSGIVFCGHNVLYWLLLLRKLGLVRCHIVSNLWAREPLDLAGAHSGIVGLTRAGAEQAREAGATRQGGRARLGSRSECLSPIALSA